MGLYTKEMLAIADEYIQLDSNNFDELLMKLRQVGASQKQCTVILKQKFDLSLREADQIVVNSETWKDFYAATSNSRREWDDFFDNLEDNLNKP